MKRLKAVIAYDGTLFSGYQKQPNKRTVQQEIEDVLAKIHKAENWKVVASGRTDTAVHSFGQTIHFDTHLNIELNKWKKALNSLLPDDIYVRKVDNVSPQFHARYDAVGKMYQYKLNTAMEQNIFRRHYEYYIREDLSLEKMEEAAKYLIGTHDFTSFSSPKTSVVDKVRTIYTIHIDKNGDDWTISYIGNGFLYQMIRILTGTLIHVGKGKIKPEDVQEILMKKDRKFAGPTVPGKGLYLSKVFYDDNLLKKEIAIIEKKVETG